MTLIRSSDRKVTNAVTISGNPAIKNAFGLPAGDSCPGMTSFCNKICYAGRNERQYTNVSRAVWANFQSLLYADYLRGIGGMVDLLIPMVSDFLSDTRRRNAKPYFRIHWDGDFFSTDYAYAWALVCKAFPEVDFWVYTRSFDVLPYITGVDNLTVYLSADPVNEAEAKRMAAKYNLPIALVADTFAEAREYLPVAYNCPENGKRLDLISPKGSACGRCGVCIEGRGNVAFSVRKK